MFCERCTFILNKFFYYSEADLEDLINHLFHQAMHTDGSGNQWQQPQSPASASSQNTSNWSSTSGTGNTNKKSRRRKKKH